MKTIRIEEDVPVIAEADVCVLGGSCTGVFAAVRAARLGARVALVEKQGHFGGVAPVTCTWHSLRDTAHRQSIVAGLTREVLERLGRRGALETVPGNEARGYVFRPGDLKIVLDGLVLENRIAPHLHTLFTRPVVENGRLAGVVVESKSGRGVLRARAFVDATGDGDLCARLGVPTYAYEAPLPPTTCAFLDRWPDDGAPDVGALVRQHGADHGLESGFVWGTLLPGTDVYMLAGTRVRHADCAHAGDLTRAEIEGRRQVGAILDLIRARRPDSKVALHDFPCTIGIRDTRHVRCRYTLTGEDVLEGRRFPDAVANGSYRVDIHHQDKPGITFLHLDGRTFYCQPGLPAEQGRWREPRPADPTFYQVPLRSLMPAGHDNLFAAGRMLDADITAFSAVRVMVNTNQTGEAAGVAAFCALDSGAAADPARVRRLLADGGSLVL
jgi:hypothetical protein